jgi:hypothetical protein
MSTRQYLRQCRLIIADNAGDALDLSNLRIKFTVKKTDAQTPNTAEIQVWNLAEDTANRVKKEFTRVTLEAGYEGNVALIFNGNVKRISKGKENGVDSYIMIHAGDGDEAYNYSVINTTLASGATQNDQVNAAVNSMSSRGVSAGAIPNLGAERLARGKVMYGMSRDYLRQSSETTGSTWSIQDGKVQYVGLTDVLPNQAVVLNSNSGLIGSAEQTTQGIKAKCLLNPMLKIASKVSINEDDISEEKGGQSEEGEKKKPAEIAADGLYRLLAVEHVGDTHGNEWFSNLVCLDVDATQPPKKSVKKT